MRNLQQYNVEWFYNYFKEYNSDIDINTFQQGFQFLNLESVLNHLDHKFNLTVLYSKDNNFIKVIE